MIGEIICVYLLTCSGTRAMYHLIQPVDEPDALVNGPEYLTLYMNAGGIPETVPCALADLYFNFTECIMVSEQAIFTDCIVSLLSSHA